MFRQGMLQQMHCTSTDLLIVAKVLITTNGPCNRIGMRNRVLVSSVEQVTNFYAGFVRYRSCLQEFYDMICRIVFLVYAAAVLAVTYCMYFV